jgi:hypothetical protein
LEDGPVREALIGLGGKPWVYHGQAKPMTMKNWIVVPEEFYDDHELLGEWAKRARELAPPKKTPVKKPPASAKSSKGQAAHSEGKKTSKRSPALKPEVQGPKPRPAKKTSTK